MMSRARRRRVDGKEGGVRRTTAGTVVLLTLFASTAVAAGQAAQAILVNPGQVNASTTGTSWWLANQSLVVTWDAAAGIRVASVFDRLGGRTGTKPGDAFSIALGDGRTVRSVECRLRSGPAVEKVTGGAALAASFACPDESLVVAWGAQLLSGADRATQVVTVTGGTGTPATGEVGYQADPAKAPAQGRAVAVLAGPYLQKPGPSSVTVMWITDGPAAGWVEYSADAGARGSTVVLPTADGLVAAGGRIHSVTIDGLQPDTLYHYRIVTRAIWTYGPYKVDYGDLQPGEPRTFRTLAVTPRPFSFLVLNDLHENVAMLRGHIQRAQAERGFDLVFFDGDSLSHLESQAQIVRHLAPASQAFAGTVPFVLVRGNHETRGRYARELKSHLALPDDRFYFAFSHGGVRFIVLDTGEDKEDAHWAYSGLTSFATYRKAQAEWLRQEVQSAEFKAARFRVLVAHMPFFGNERTRVSGAGPAACREAFGPILNAAGIDLHIAGHTHRVDWVEPSEGANRFPIVVGGGSAAGTNTATRVDVTADGLVITQTTDDGKVVGTRRVGR
jgi:predicted phosphodiesterase